MGFEKIARFNQTAVRGCRHRDERRAGARHDPETVFNDFTVNVAGSFGIALVPAGIIAGIREPLTDTLRPTCLTRLTVVLESMSVVVVIAMAFCFAEDAFIESAAMRLVSATARASVNRPSAAISRQPV
jgi:hypothetical protein